MRKSLILFCFFVFALLMSCSEDTLNVVDDTTPFNQPKSDVRVFTESEAGYVIEEATEDKIVFNGSTPSEIVPKVGSIIQLPISDNTPFGFLGRVVSVNSGDKIEVNTELVPLEEAYPNLSLDVDLTKIDHVYGVFDEDGNPVDFHIVDIAENDQDATAYGEDVGKLQKKGKDDDYVEFLELDWEKKKLSIPIPEKWVKTFTKENIDINGLVTLSFEGSSIKTDNKGEAKYIDIDIRPHVTVGGELVGHIKQLTSSSTKKTWETPKLTFKGTVVVGGIVFPITVPIWLKAELKGDFSTSVELRYNKSWRLRYVYKDGKWCSPDYNDPEVVEDNPWYVTEFDASGKFSVGPDIEFNVGIFSRKVGFGMEFYPNAYLSAEASLSSLNPFEFNPDVEVGIGMNWRAYCRSELFGKKVEPFSINLPDITFVKRTLSLFPNISEFDAVGGSLSAELSWRSDSHYLLSLLGVKTGATLFKPDNTEEYFFPDPTHTDRLGQRYYNVNVSGLRSGTTYYAAPNISWLRWNWHGEKKAIQTEAKYHLAFRCVNQSYDVIDFDFSLNDKSGNVIDYTTEATDYDGSPMRVHITATYDASNKTLNGTFDFYFYDDPSQKRKDGFSVSLASDDSGYVDCTKVIDNGGCYAALRIYKLTSTRAARKRYNKPLVKDDCNIGIFNKHYKK